MLIVRYIERKHREWVANLDDRWTELRTGAKMARMNEAAAYEDIFAPSKTPSFLAEKSTFGKLTRQNPVALAQGTAALAEKTAIAIKTGLPNPAALAQGTASAISGTLQQSASSLRKMKSPSRNAERSSSLWRERNAAREEVGVPERPDMPMPQPAQAARANDASASSLAGAKLRANLPAGLAATDAERCARLRKAALRMRDPAYSLREYHDDMIACFPELRLYLADGESADCKRTSSGRSTEVEYLRTIGAFFALYWLMRLPAPSADADAPGLDGQYGFCFGVDAEWKPWRPDARDVPRLDAECRRRHSFLRSCDWRRLQELLIHAGMLAPASCSGSDGEDGLTVVEERTVAMLTLTAIHDIMKIDELLPTVGEAHAPFAGVSAGATIIDHDLALAYVLEHDPTALPSFDVLPRTEQDSIRFTQAQLGFNHGWLVQVRCNLPPSSFFLRPL